MFWKKMKIAVAVTIVAVVVSGLAESVVVNAIAEETTTPVVDEEAIAETTKVQESIEKTEQEYNMQPTYMFFGQTPPGAIPKVFAPGIVCLENRNETGLTFTPDGKELFFSTKDEIYQMQYKEGQWTQPNLADIFEPSGNIKNLRIAPDGQTLTFMRARDLYICTRKGGEVSSPQKLPEQINSEKFECSISCALGNSVYFASRRPGGKGKCDIFFSQYNQGQYSDPVNLESFNTSGSECEVYIAPDESFIIFNAYDRPDGFGGGDMYVSFMEKNRKWSKPQNMGPKLNKQSADGPIGLSPDGKYFFFYSFTKTASGFDSDIYWVDAKIIETFRPINQETQKAK